MATNILTVIAIVFGVTVLVVGTVRLVQVPFAIAYEVSHRALPRYALRVQGSIFDDPPSVSVIVPAYNEEVVLENCIRSIVASDYPNFDVICVDDGSSDNTFAIMQRLAAELPRVQAMTQDNAGKGAALNRGIAASTGKILVLVDSDGVFRRDTITEMVRGFEEPDVGAVCGDDRTVNLDRVQTKFLSLISHVGTGLMRRALHMLRALPVVSGNTGAFRREVLGETGLLRTDTIGEDLELTWRIYRAGYRVSFRTRAIVYAESPSTIRGLFKQRVRWARGLLQSCRLHKDMIGNPEFKFFGVQLLLSYISGVLVPVMQVLALFVLGALFFLGRTDVVPLGFWAWLVFLGIPVSFALLVLAVVMGGAARDLRYSWTLVVWPFYSALMSAVMLRALWLEARGAENKWNKLTRTGTVSIKTGPSDPPGYRG